MQTGRKRVQKQLIGSGNKISSSTSTMKNLKNSILTKTVITSVHKIVKLKLTTVIIMLLIRLLLAAELCHFVRGFSKKKKDTYEQKIIFQQCSSTCRSYKITESEVCS